SVIKAMGSTLSACGDVNRNVLAPAAPCVDRPEYVHAQELANDMNIHPFVAQKALDQARKFSFADLRAVHDMLFEYDAGMKSGYLDADVAVDLVMTRLVA
ncbi:hypothetical protein EBS80_01365, partial [bacterium]|nr:hypothetical protein [bacterium]